MVKVELVYIAADKSLTHLKLELANGATVGDAIAASGIESTHPEVRGLPVGLFSRRVSLETLLNSGDRIEIYRALTFSPKENRRKRSKS
ncbi:MAG: RnfH family protein [Tatlockia sp.]|jgi:hypothetical protein